MKPLWYRLLTLDIFDLNYAMASEPLARARARVANPPHTSLLHGIAVFCWLAGQALIRRVQQPGPLRARAQPYHQSILVFITSRNTYETLAPVARQMPNRAYMLREHQLDAPGSVEFPLRDMAWLLALPWLPLVLWRYLRASGYQQASFTRADGLAFYWLTYGYYLAATFWLARLRPGALVVANDHVMQCRVMTRVAQEAQIPTFYLPHAAVNERFPPLQFSYALLNGMDDLLTYQRAGVADTRVFLIGMPRADQYLAHRNTRTYIAVVGICPGLHDPLDRGAELLAHLRTTCPDLRVILRPHPINQRRILAWQKLAHQYGIAFSDPRDEQTGAFLCRVDAIVAGESNIILEATIMNVLPLFYDFGEHRLDWYRFQRNGLVTYAATPPEISAQLRASRTQKPAVHHRAAHYCATLGTAAEGRSSQLASELITTLSRGHPLDTARWRPVPGVAHPAYVCATPPAPTDAATALHRDDTQVYRT